MKNSKIAGFQRVRISSKKKICLFFEYLAGTVAAEMRTGRTIRLRTGPQSWKSKKTGIINGNHQGVAGDTDYLDIAELEHRRCNRACHL